MFFGAIKPLFDGTCLGAFVVQPILILSSFGRIDHAGYVARTSHNKFGFTAEVSTNLEGRWQWRNVVFAGCKIVDRDFYFREIDWHTVQNHFALAQLVVEIAFSQIETVRCSGHSGWVCIPIQQIKGEGVLAQHVVVDHIRPDQII